MSLPGLKIISLTHFTHLQLTEVIRLAGELKQDDQKLAAWLWHMAVQHIQALWGKTVPTPPRKVCMAHYLLQHTSYLILHTQKFSVL